VVSTQRRATVAKTTSDDYRDPDLVAVQEGPEAAGEMTRPAGLDRDRILTAAIEFIDEHGLSALTTAWWRPSSTRTTATTSTSRTTTAGRTT
jgi:hypothetical protein